jgi:hypothetical protein
LLLTWFVVIPTIPPYLFYSGAAIWVGGTSRGPR